MARLTHRLPLLALVLLTGLTGCDDDPQPPDGATDLASLGDAPAPEATDVEFESPTGFDDPVAGEIGVIVHPLRDDERVSVTESGDQHVRFCYDDGDCQDPPHGSTTSDKSPLLVSSSDPERTVESIRVAFAVGGEPIDSFVQIARIESEETVGPDDFEVLEVLEQRGPVSTDEDIFWFVQPRE